MQVPCVVCDAPVIMSAAVWSSMEKPGAVCGECLENTRMGVIKQIYFLRCQVRELKEDSDKSQYLIIGLKQDVDELYEQYRGRV